MASTFIKSSMVTDYGFKSSVHTDLGLSEHVKLPSPSVVFPSIPELSPRETEPLVEVILSSAKETAGGEVLPEAAVALN